MTGVITPRVSEKAYNQASNVQTYVFNVPLDANKIEVKKYIEKEYSVSVIAVNIVKLDGKVKRSYRKGGRATSGQRSDTKKAYVRLKDGDTIPVFATQEEEAK